MTDPKEPPKTNFQRLLDWANKDRVCAMAIVLAMIGAFPNLAAFLLALARIVTSSDAVAAALK